MKRLIERLLSFFGRTRTDDKRSKDKLADLGEKMARNHLKKSGYKILETRWRWHRFELDIIARKGNVIAFVEVKSRTSDRFGLPQEAVTGRKQKRIITSARAYAAIKHLDDYLLRFDIIAIMLPPEGDAEVTHIENAFHP